MQIVGDVEPSERLIILAPHGAPYTGLGLALEQVLDIVKACDVDPALNFAQFRGLQRNLSNGVLRTSEGNRFGLGLDGSLAVRRRLFHDRPGKGRVVQRGDVGLYSSLEQLFAAILYVRKVVEMTNMNRQLWSFRHQLYGIHTRHLMDDCPGGNRTENEWPISEACVENMIEFAGEIDLRTDTERIAQLFDEAGVKIAAPFDRHQLVSLMKPGTFIIMSMQTQSSKGPSDG